jgi:acid phosphatase
MYKSLIAVLGVGILLQACGRPPAPAFPPTLPPLETGTPFHPPTASPAPSATATASPTPAAILPDFQHVIVIVFENKEIGTVIGNSDMGYFNSLAASYTLLAQHFAPAHPSLPNYLALIGGDTFGVTSNCEDCFVAAPSLPDLIEASGRTWRAYQEDMPRPCFLGSTLKYAQKHNPFIYFDSIRLDSARCERSIVPLDQLAGDLDAGALPNFVFITPNLCNDAHDCGLPVADAWLQGWMERLVPALDSTGKPYLIILTWDEGQGDHSCCGLPASAGGRIATVLVSPQVRRAFQDVTPYTHYSILKTIAEAWGLPSLGHAADENTALILLPFQP